MEIFYELIMKNGSCFLVGTNCEGICEFSINGSEFVIHTVTDGKGEFINFSFSVATDLLPDVRTKEYQVQEEFSVISVRKVDEKKNKHLKKMNILAGEDRVDSSEGKWGTYFVYKKLHFCAHQGRINTPIGWLCA